MHLVDWHPSTQFDLVNVVLFHFLGPPRRDSSLDLQRIDLHRNLSRADLPQQTLSRVDMHRKAINNFANSDLHNYDNQDVRRNCSANTFDLDLVGPRK